MIKTLAALCAALGMAAVTVSPQAQAVRTPRTSQTPSIQVAVTGLALRSLSAGTGQGFGQGGGSASVAVRVYDGVGIVADVMGTHTGSAGSSGLPLSLVTTTFGPRYTRPLSDRVSVYGQGLVGVANGFNSLFPTGNTVNTSASSLAVQAGVGLDVTLRRRFAIRALDAAYVRTTLPNAQGNVQNNFRIGAGVVVHFR